ncbi:amidase [Dactylosporangium roseum]|uniref:Amidase n=1 Tax=Dactylosporangium roseum TaxID=47989 RepID=A0ABY5Z2D3_9ACTN|nr:amidase [Dactylosporangium roseum]UWZ34634.1 amidase [Dactylosporangium roseum]
MRAVDLAGRCLDRADRAGRPFGSIAALAADRAMAEAVAADARIAAGDPDPLLGIPYGVKDVIAARGAPTSWGVTSLRDRILDEDATVVDRLGRRGGVLVAKLVTSSLAGGGGTDRPGVSAHGQARNPWAPDRFPGGSSSGSAIAVALGAVPYALGSETGGSVVQPAAFCGVTGYRPTWSRIPRTGMMALSAKLDKVGVLARTAADCALVAEALIGPDGIDDDCRPEPAVPARQPAVDRLVVGISPNDLDRVADPMRATARRGLDELAALVGEVRPVEISREIGYSAAIELIVSADAHRSLSDLIWSPDVELADAGQLARLRAARDIPAAAYAEALDVQRQAREQFANVFREVDLVVGVSISDQPQLRDEPRRPRGSTSVADRLLAAANLAGLPGVAVPCGLDDDGLPVSLHLVGPRHSDRLLLAVASHYQQHTSHHQLRPTTSVG